MILFDIYRSLFSFSGHRDFLLWQFDEIIATLVEIGIFPIPNAYWSGFGIFKQNRDNPDEIGMGPHSHILRGRGGELVRQRFIIILYPKNLQYVKFLFWRNVHNACSIAFWWCCAHKVGIKTYLITVVIIIIVVVVFINYLSFLVASWFL